MTSATFWDSFPRPHPLFKYINQLKLYLSTAFMGQGCQMAKFDPFLSLDCARVEGVGAQSKERKGSNFAA